MERGQKGKLIIDVWTSGKKDKQTKPYGNVNEKVTIISVSGDVAIVEGEKGNRFPVRKEVAIWQNK